MDFKYLVFFISKTSQGIFPGSLEMMLKFKIESIQHVKMVEVRIKEDYPYLGNIHLMSFNLIAEPKKPKKGKIKGIYYPPAKILNGQK